MKHGDVVLSYQDKPVADSSGLRNEVADTPTGQDVKLTVWRDKKQETVRVRIVSMEDSVKSLSAAVDNRLGVTVRPITPKEDEKYGIDPGEGVAIKQEPLPVKNQSYCLRAYRVQPCEAS